MHQVDGKDILLKIQEKIFLLVEMGAINFCNSKASRIFRQVHYIFVSRLLQIFPITDTKI